MTRRRDLLWSMVKCTHGPAFGSGPRASGRCGVSAGAGISHSFSHALRTRQLLGGLCKLGWSDGQLKHRTSLPPQWIVPVLPCDHMSRDDKSRARDDMARYISQRQSYHRGDGCLLSTYSCTPWSASKIWGPESFRLPLVTVSSRSPSQGFNHDHDTRRW